MFIYLIFEDMERCIKQNNAIEIYQVQVIMLVQTSLKSFHPRNTLKRKMKQQNVKLQRFKLSANSGLSECRFEKEKELLN